MRQLSTFFIILLICTNFINSTVAQTTCITQFATVLNNNHSIGLNNPISSFGCNMTYDAAMVNTLGGAFSMNFTNPEGGAGYKGYPSGTIGGFKKGSTYYTGVPNASGMPVQVQNLTNDLRIKWKVTQENAYDAGDKWWASINVIFDNGAANVEPDPVARDYDLVIELNRYEQEDLTDKPKTGNTVYWKFARNANGSLKTFNLNYGGQVYQWAVRYKFFNYPVGDPDYDKNDKVHVKFIAADNNNVAPYLDHPLKSFVDASKSYLQNANLATDEMTLANAKVALPTTWIKSISAGYEIYTGDFTIKNDYFYTVIDQVAPAIPAGLMANRTGSNMSLDWSDVSETSLEGYYVYRSINGGSFQNIATAYTSNFTDENILSTNNYAYRVVAMDRSFNLSAQSSTVSSPAATVLPLNLLTFTATKSNNSTVQLNWQTADEKNVAQFEIQRSADGKNFTPLSILKAKNGISQSYQIFDEIPSKGINYYRLKMVDNDGRLEYSNTQSVAFKGEGLVKVKAYPNPVRDILNLNISTDSETQTHIELYDIMGKKVYYNDFMSKEGDNQLSIPTTHFAKGFYTLKINQAGVVKTEKIIVGQ